MHTEITEHIDTVDWVFFDGDCPACAAAVRRLKPLLSRYRFAFAPLQTDWVKERLRMSDEEQMSQMRLLTRSGELYGGADAIIAIAAKIWWALPLCWFAKLPLLRRGLHRIYRFIARNRYCLNNRCRGTTRGVSRTPVALRWGLAALPLLLAIPAGTVLPGWVWMWCLAFALFFGAKWITLSRLLSGGTRISAVRRFAYFFFWPGMDAYAFCGDRAVPAPTFCEWRKATVITIFGVGLLWLGVPGITTGNPLLAGWVGMWAMVLTLHFGFFHLLSLFWRSRGINAKPIMRSPATATSLSVFWGQRWNTGFNDLINRSVYRPLARRVGAQTAVWITFLASGILHELVISVPARSGYGLPTAYFLLQAVGLNFERSRAGGKMGLGKGWSGWCFVVLMAALPAYFLFAPAFILHLILPMLHAIGAIR